MRTMKTMTPCRRTQRGPTLIWIGLLLGIWTSMLAQTPPREGPAVIRLVYPTAGMTLGLDAVHFQATALDPDGGPLTRVEFLAGDQVVAVSDRSGDVFATVVGLAVPHKAVWTKATLGVHVIRARAVVQGEGWHNPTRCRSW